MGSSLHKYETDAGGIVRIRLSDEKFALAGAEAAGTLTDSRQRVSASGSRRRFNTIVARARIYSFSEDTASGLKASKTLTLPILTPAAFATAAPATVTYKGQTYKFVDLNAED